MYVPRRESLEFEAFNASETTSFLVLQFPDAESSKDNEDGQENDYKSLWMFPGAASWKRSGLKSPIVERLHTPVVPVSTGKRVGARHWERELF